MLEAAVFTTISLLLLLGAEHRDWQRGKWVFKPLASAGFLSFGVAAGCLQGAFGQVLFGGLLLSALGDVLLIPKGTGAGFQAGIGAFLLGHVAFAAAFVVLGVSWAQAALVLLLLLIPAELVRRWIVPRASEQLRKPVLAYVAVITTMLALAIAAWLAGAPSLALVAALLFYLSDLCVARQRFVTPGFINRLVGLPLYYGAQLLFGASVASLG